MEKKLDILILEDVASDAELVEHELRKEKIEFSSKCVETKKDFLRELTEFTPDIIISDYSLPQFDGLAALELVKKHTPLVPFIMCTGSLTEETAADCIKAGAADYVIKEHLVRIGPAVKGALEKKRVREEIERAEEALRISAREWHTTFNAISDGLCLLDLDGKVGRCNKAMTKLLNKPLKDILGQDCCTLQHGTPKPIEDCPFIRMCKSHKREVLVFQRGNRWYNCSVDPILDKAGNLIRAAIILSDITEQKKVEEELAKERNLLRTIIDVIPDMIYVKDKESRFITCNTSVSRIMGASTPEELIGKTDFDYYSNELASEYYNDEKKIIQTGKQLIDKEEPNIDKNGTLHWVLTTKIPLHDNDGNIIGIVGIGRDITERREAEEELRKLSIAVEQSSAGILITDPEGKIEYINPRFTDITGYTYKEAIGNNPHILKSGEYTPEFYKQLWDTITSGEEWHGELHNKKKDGELYWEHASISPIKNEEGKITHFLGVKEDITEHKNLEGQLQQAQKMEAIGRFAGGIAHDFNNMMTAVIGFSDYLLSQLKESDSTRSIIEQIKKAGGRAASLTHQLLAFSRRQVMQTQLLDINTIISDMEQMLNRLLGADIELRTALSTKSAQVKADQSQIEQIIMNLVVNARDAMPKGGKLIIETSKTEFDEDYCHKWIDVEPGRYVMLTISDSGCGMDKETQVHIFEPFYTTKEVGKGTGLGLSTVYGIVNQNNGHIHVYSEQNKGTTFKIYFPYAIEDNIDVGTTEKVSKGSLKGSETVLVVEDEELVRELTTSVLKKNEYTVLEASNSEEALTIGKNYPGEILLMITDIIMPGMQGPALAKEILSMRPEINVLFMSGYTDKAAEQLELLDHEALFIQKPFTPNKILSKIKEILQKNVVDKNY